MKCKREEFNKNERQTFNYKGKKERKKRGNIIFTWTIKTYSLTLQNNFWKYHIFWNVFVSHFSCSAKGNDA